MGMSSVVVRLISSSSERCQRGKCTKERKNNDVRGIRKGGKISLPNLTLPPTCKQIQKWWSFSGTPGQFSGTPSPTAAPPWTWDRCGWSCWGRRSWWTPRHLCSAHLWSEAFGFCWIVVLWNGRSFTKKEVHNLTHPCSLRQPERERPGRRSRLCSSYLTQWCPGRTGGSLGRDVRTGASQLAALADT